MYKEEQYHVTLLPDNREHVTYERKGMDYKFYYFPFSTTKPFNFDTEMYEIIAEDLVQQWVVFESEYPDYRNIWNSNH